MRYLILGFAGLAFGMLLGAFILRNSTYKSLAIPILKPQRQVIGFLPFGILGKTNTDFSKYITTLDYFALTVGTDGHIQKLTNPQETEPGWYSLDSGKLDLAFNQMRQKGVTLSLVIFNGDNDSIYQLINDPLPHAQNLISDLAPVMKKYGFSDLNLDIESPKEASEEARVKFGQFAGEVKNGLQKNQLGTLTVDISPTAFVKKYLIDPEKIKDSADYLFIMGYDYHYQGSTVSGPVAPLYGAGVGSEFDIDTAIQKALKILPKEKILLGLPLYGYEWETLTNFARSATIPGSSLTISNNRAEQFLPGCDNCKVELDPVAQERYFIYQDKDTGTYHQAFFPDQDTTKIKIDYAKKLSLGGVGFWALGFEGQNILDALNAY